MRTICADVCALELDREFELILAPMQLLQALGSAAARRAALERAADHLAPGGRLAAAIVEPPSPTPDGPAAALPDIRELDGWVYSSLPAVQVTAGGQLVIRRHRQAVSPDGSLSEEECTDRLDALDAEALEAEAADVGPAPRCPTRGAARGRLLRLHRRDPGAALMELRTVALYPEQMNIYADRGNILFLRRRCEWRGIDFSYDAAGAGEPLDAAAHDLIYVGGGQDRDQRIVAEDMLASKRAGLAEAVEDGAVVLAVCGGYQLLGHSYELGDERIPGLGLADLETVRQPGPRLIGNIEIEVDLGDGPRELAGFENHGGRTYLGDGAKPLGRVVRGHGNNGSDGLEGVRRRNMIGTYLHGPLLPKNAWLADRLIQLALARRHGTEPELAPLDDALETAAHEAARRAALRG